jgi:hypothetical protein
MVLVDVGVLGQRVFGHGSVTVISWMHCISTQSVGAGGQPFADTRVTAV